MNNNNTIDIPAVSDLPNVNDTTATAKYPMGDTKAAAEPFKKQKAEIPPMPKLPLSSDVKHVRKIDIAVKVIMSLLGTAAHEIYGLTEINKVEETEKNAVQAGVAAGVGGGTALLAGLAVAGTKFWYGLRKFGHCLCPAEKGGCMVCQHKEVVDVKHGLFVDTAYVRDAGGCHCSCEDVDPDYAKTSRFKWPEFTGGEKAATIVSQLLLAGGAVMGNIFIPTPWAAIPVAAVCFSGLSAAPYIVEKIHDRREWKKRFLSGNETMFPANLSGESKIPVPSEFKGIVEYSEHISKVIGMIRSGKLAPEDVWKQNVLLPEGNKPTVYDLSRLMENSLKDIKDSVMSYDEIACNFETVDTKKWLCENRSDIDPVDISKLPFGCEMEYTSFDTLPVPEKWDESRGSYMDFVLQTAKLLNEGKISENDAVARGVIPIKGLSAADTCKAWVMIAEAVDKGELTENDVREKMKPVSDADAYWDSIKEPETISVSDLKKDVVSSSSDKAATTAKTTNSSPKLHPITL